MTEKIKNRITVILFLFILFGFLFASLLSPKAAVSASERRRLQQIPPLTAKAVWQDRNWTGLFEHYLMDQFVLRDQLRWLKAVVTFDFFRQLDNNKIFVLDQNVFKLEYQLDEASVLKAADRINDLAAVCFPTSRLFYTIIPDKSFYIDSKQGYPAMDYDRLQAVLSQSVNRARYISILDDLDLDCYFRTDIHWKQESLGRVVDRLGSQLGFTADAVLTEASLYPFYGGYYGQSALNIAPDRLTYLEHEMIRQAAAIDLVKKVPLEIYNLEQFKGMDPYSVFLEGPVAAAEIINPLQENNRELVIFRDSYGSSLAPLLIPYYSKIILIDIRYVPFARILDYVTPAGQDVLVLYSALLMNTSYLLK